MISHVCVVLLASLSSQADLDTVKEQLFTKWSSSSIIPMVTFGLPTQGEKDVVAELVEAWREDVITATAGDLSSSDCALDVPFMLGMIDGITMEYAPHFAETCVAHLADLDDAVSGIAASRLWRMRLRAAILMGDMETAEYAAKSIRAVREADQEDLVVATLFDIQKAFDRKDLVAARFLYDTQDATLVSTKRQLLRDPFASAYAKLAPTTEEAVYGWCSLAQWTVAYGYDQADVDHHLRKQLDRLSNPPNVIQDNEDPRIAALATRLMIEQQLEEHVEVAFEALMQLARNGDVRSAERVLQRGDQAEAKQYLREALDIVLGSPKQLHTPPEYWYLYAATIEVRHGMYEKALAYLAHIPETSLYSDQARSLEQQLQGLNVGGILTQLQRTPPDMVAQTANQLVAHSPPVVVQEVLRHCIEQWHLEGASQNGWLRKTVSALLASAEHVSPSVTAEAYRLTGQIDRATPLFQKAIRLQGLSIQTTAGLADCTRDLVAMQRVGRSASHDDHSAYWYWLSNVRVLQWYLEDGGDRPTVVAKVNRLRKKDASLGGVQFSSQLNALCR